MKLLETPSFAFVEWRVLLSVYSVYMFIVAFYRTAVFGRLLKYSKRDALAAMWTTSLHRQSTAEFLRTVAITAVVSFEQIKTNYSTE
jgi:hypothetical protein